MAVPGNTITRHTHVKAAAEDVSNIISRINPEDTPFTSNIGSDTVDSVYYEWLTDRLKSPTATNAQIEGDDAALDQRTDQLRMGNYTQISRLVIGVSGTTEAVKKYGMRSTLAYELAKAGAELKQDVETSLISNNAANAGSASTARYTAGYTAWLRTNVNKASGGVNPTLSSTTQGYPNAARTFGTARTFTEDLLRDVLQKVWTKGGKPKIVMTDGFNKGKASSFPGIAAQRYNAPSASATTIIGAADVYVSDWGKISFVPNVIQQAPVNAAAFVIDPSKVKKVTLRDYQTKDLAITGDNTKKQLLVEYGLKVDNEEAHGIIADLTTS